MTLPAWAVESLRRKLAAATDEAVTPDERRRAVQELLGALDYHLNGAER